MLLEVDKDLRTAFDTEVDFYKEQGLFDFVVAIAEACRNGILDPKLVSRYWKLTLDYTVANWNFYEEEDLEFDELLDSNHDLKVYAHYRDYRETFLKWLAEWATVDFDFKFNLRLIDIQRSLENEANCRLSKLLVHHLKYWRLDPASLATDSTLIKQLDDTGADWRSVLQFHSLLEKLDEIADPRIRLGGGE